MGDWGGAPPGWVPPEDRKERAAAAEAAERMAAARAAADDRAGALADAIVYGCRMLSAALLAASPHSETMAIDRYNAFHGYPDQTPEPPQAGDSGDRAVPPDAEYMEGDGDDEIRLTPTADDADPDIQDLLRDPEGHGG